MKKILYTIILLFSCLTTFGQVWSNTGTANLQRTPTIKGYMYRNNIGALAPNFVYWYTQQQIDSLLSGKASVSSLSNFAQKNGSNVFTNGEQDISGNSIIRMVDGSQIVFMKPPDYVNAPYIEGANIKNTGGYLSLRFTAFDSGGNPVSDNQMHFNPDGTATLGVYPNLYKVLTGNGSPSDVILGDGTYAPYSGGGGGGVSFVATGFGLLGGPITSSGTLKADSTALVTLLSLNSRIASYGGTVFYPISANPAGYLTSITSGQVTGALGFTPENIANKTATPSTSTTTYPNWLGVENYVTGQGYITSSSTNTVTNKDLSSGTNTFPTFNQNTTGNAGTVTSIGNLTGDVTSVNRVTSLSTVNSNVGTFGDATHVAAVTVNAKGLITGVTSVAITGGGTNNQTIQNNGSSVTQRPIFNMVGPYLKATDNSGSTRTDLSLNIASATSDSTTTIFNSAQIKQQRQADTVGFDYRFKKNTYGQVSLKADSSATSGSQAFLASGKIFSALALKAGLGANTFSGTQTISSGDLVLPASSNVYMGSNYILSGFGNNVYLNAQASGGQVQIQTVGGAATIATFFDSGNVTIDKLKTGGTAPTTTGTTKMVISDSNGLLSFANIPSGGGTTTNSLTPGYGLTPSNVFDGSVARTFNADSTLLANKIFFNSVVGTTALARLALKLNISDTTAAFAKLVHIAGPETIQGPKIFTNILKVQKAGQVANFGISSPGADVYVSVQGNGSYDVGVSNSTGNLFFGSGGVSAININNAGNVSLGGSNVSSGVWANIAAGSTTVAPMRYSSGALTTTAVAGNQEFLTDKFYGTITTGTARKEYALWDAAGTSGRVPYETTNGRFIDAANFTYSGTVLSVPTFSAGIAGTTLGTYNISGNTSGTISIKPQAAAGTYNFNLPITAGTANYAMLSQAGGSTAMTWGAVPITQATADLTAQTAAGNITTFTVGASTTTFSVSAYLNVTAVATDVIETQVTYTDENSTSQTVTFFNMGATSALISTISNSTYPPLIIRAKNGTVITAKTTLTTGAGSITFDAGARIIQQ